MITSNRRRILSIDGGGIKGVFPVSFLAAIESTLGIDSVANYFDLIAGTSVGGIIALGLGLGFNARALLDFFNANGSVIFPSSFVPTSTVRLWFGGERYSPAPLRKALEETFGNKTLGDSKVRLLIPSFDATSADIHVYKTRHNPRLRTDHTLKAVDVAMATAAAPTYFSGYDSQQSITLVDGGVWANNPVGLAVVEAVGLLGWNGDETDILSLGCTEESIDYKQRGHGGAFWLARAFQAGIRGQSRSAIGMARHLTGRDKNFDNVLRIDPPVERNRFKLDDVKGIKELTGLGYAQARHHSPAVKERFFGAPAEVFSPCPL
jgi:patatin-like phospholipase/acyl hydrolase